MAQLVKRFFGLDEHRSTYRTEIIAGVTTFMTMAYILAVNPELLGVPAPAGAGMPREAVFTATALAAVVATVAMAFLGRLPFALASGMGLNAFFSFTICGAMGYDWSFALTAVFLEGLIFLALTLFNIREAIIDSIPLNLKRAISVGIGLFIAIIGLRQAGVVMGVTAFDLTQDGQVVHDVIAGVPLELSGQYVPAEDTGFAKTLPALRLGSLTDPTVIVCLAGLVFGALLVALRIKGALLIAILGATLLGLPLGVTQLEGVELVSMPASIEPIFLKFQWSQVFSFDMALVLFTLLFVDMFDTLGTLIGVTTKAGMLDAQGKVPRAKGALLADAIGTTVGAMLGTSTVTTYVESAAGVEEGGRTGVTSLVVALLFAVALFFSGLFLAIPSAATAPALILVGIFMMSPIKDIDFGDFTELAPAFLCLFMMPMTYSIADGIAFGLISYVLLKAGSGQGRQVSWMTYCASLFFVGSFVAKILVH
jgi:AGZA family xanthine/uracil permease-like MFS transporter